MCDVWDYYVLLTNIHTLYYETFLFINDFYLIWPHGIWESLIFPTATSLDGWWQRMAIFLLTTSKCSGLDSELDSQFFFYLLGFLFVSVFCFSYLFCFFIGFCFCFSYHFVFYLFQIFQILSNCFFISLF